MELSASEMIASVSSGEQSPQGGAPQADSQQQAQASQQQALNELEYEVKGKKIREPLDMIRKRASAGYHYAQQMEAFNKERQEWEAARKAEQEKWEAERKAYEPFKEMEDYARQNPQWVEYWKRAYEARNTPIPQGQPVEGSEQGAANPFDLAAHPYVKSLEEKISKLDQFFQDQKAREEQARVQQEDTAYRTAVDEVKKEWPTIDFDQADEHGRSLEYRILQHARANGINNFRSAFRDYYFDQLATKKAEQAKEALVQSKVADKRQGIVARGSAGMPQSARIDYKKTSWDDLSSLAKREAVGGN